MILKSFLKKQYLDQTSIETVNIHNPANFVAIEDIYCGAKVGLFIQNENINVADLKNFRLRVLEFYIELSFQIKKRFNFQDQTLKFARKFDPQMVCQGEFNSVSEALPFFPNLDLDIEKLDFEYRLISETEEIKKYKCDLIDDFWKKVSNMKNAINEPMFPNIVKVANCVMCLPHSSAAAERIFSQLNIIKTKTRNRLLLKTCASLLHAKDKLKVSGDNCFTWKPPCNMLKTWYKSKDKSDYNYENEIVFG